MDQYFRDLLESLKDAAQHLIGANEHLVAASQGVQAAGNALVRVGEMAIHASHEHEDLRDTVARLETTVLDLVHEVRELRSERNGGS
jgi:hypothetical protein